MARALLPVLALAGCLLSGCRTTAPAAGPEDGARAYARALREADVDDAWRQLPRAQREGGLDLETFRRRYADAQVREARAAQVEGALEAPERRAGDVVLMREDGAWRVREPVNGPSAREALAAFLDAAEAGDFQRAWALLGAPLRARYTAERLAEDFRAEPQAKERLARARAALDAAPELEGDEARFPLGDGRAVRLVREAGGYRVAALE